MQENHKLPKTQLPTIFHQVINAIEDWLVLTDKEGNISYINTYVEKISGYTKDEVLGKKQVDVWLSEESKGIYEAKQQAMASNESVEIITSNRKLSGEVFYLNNRISCIRGSDNEVLCYMYVAKDITSTRNLEEQIYRMNHYDELTNLPNQNAFCEFIYRQIAEDKKENKKFGVILIDVKKMSYINNTYGLCSGDVAIREVGKRIHKVLDSQNMLAKLNGDVFGIVQINLEDNKKIGTLLDKILAVTREPVLFETGEAYIDIHAGIVIYPEDATKAEELVNKAHIALDNAKKITKVSPYMFYTPSIQNEIQEQMLLENDMHKAYDNDEFIVYYQPFVNLENQKIIGLEALLRRVKRDGEIILPGKFIPLLEQMKLIEKVGIRVIEKVCIQLRSWMDRGFKTVPVAVNLSAMQFKNKHLAKNIMEILYAYDIPPNLITLEITETVLMEDVPLAQKIIRELRENGFVIALDDFGTGYSSLGYLKKFSCDHLKIDISFIREIQSSLQDRVIVSAIISIAKSLNLKTIAEGIETKEQLKLIQEMGCEIGQGYFWDAPIHADKIEHKYLGHYEYNAIKKDYAKG
ncbi:MAG: EAL domain-containing protein [Cellulosilyticaceae bacterium]